MWLVNTGWSGGGLGKGKRISLAHTRAIIDAIHSGQLAEAKRQEHPVFGFEVAVECPGVPSDADADAVVMQLESPLDTVQAAAELAAARGTLVIMNPAPAQRCLMSC